MMNTIVTTANGRAVGPLRQASQHLKRIGWMGYLVASFPNAKTHETTYDVLEDQFQDVPAEVMFEAARRYVREGSKWFPSVFELRPFVERVQTDAETAQVDAAWQATVGGWSKLRARRNDLLELWYAGDVGDQALLGLAEQMEQAGLGYAAASLRAKTRPSPERPDYAEFVVRYVEQLCGAAANNQG